MNFKFNSGSTSYNRNNHFFLLVSIFSIIVIVFTNCKNDFDKVGIGLIPGSEILELFSSDTTTVLVHSVFADSVKTDNTATSMLGSYLDPIFGLNTISIATQVRLSTVNMNFGENPELDSIVLVMQYSFYSLPNFQPVYYYGDTATTQTIKVFELDESLYYDSTYYSNSLVATKSTELASMDINFSPRDSIMIDSVKVKPQLRIRLNDEFGNNILNAPASVKESNENFQDFMKGLYIKPEPVANNGVIAFFDLLDINSCLNLYYKNDEGDAKMYSFLINAACARYMNFTHDYSMGDPDFVAQLNGNHDLGKEKVYLQSLGGVETRISFPYIKDWFKDQKIVINEAKLVFHNVDTNSIYKPPHELVYYFVKDDGTLGFIEDQFEGVSYFGGQYDKKKGEYFFRLSQNLQKIMLGEKENTVFTMGISGASLSPTRVAFHGTWPNDENLMNKRIKLQIKYTKLTN